MRELTPEADVLKRLIANIGAALRHVKADAEQFKNLDRWGCQIRYNSDQIAPIIGPPRPPPPLQALWQPSDLGSLHRRREPCLQEFSADQQVEQCMLPSHTEKAGDMSQLRIASILVAIGIGATVYSREENTVGENILLSGAIVRIAKIKAGKGAWQIASNRAVLGLERIPGAKGRGFDQYRMVADLSTIANLVVAAHAA